MVNRLHRFFFYILLAGVYGIFFSVESFYNFEGQGSTQDILRYSKPLRSASHHTIRLNKRFHQEDIPPCPVLPPVRPEFALTPLVLGSCRPANLPNPALLHRPLRGPPTIG